MACEIIRFDERNMIRDSALKIYSLSLKEGSSKLEAAQKEMRERKNGQLPVCGSDVMFPRYIAIGASRYPNEFFNASELETLKKLFSSSQNEIYLPVYADLINTSGIFVEHDENGAAESQKFTHNIMWSFLSGIPAAKLNISVFDCEKRGGSITPFLEFNKKVRETFDEKIFTDKEAVNERLKKYGEMIDERIQFKLGTNFDSIIEYNRNNPLKEEKIHLIVINDFPSGFGSDSANRLLSILKNGDKCGIYTIVNFNRSIKYSEYENLDPVIESIRNISDVFEIKENGCFHRNLTSPVESDIHISGSASLDFTEKYLDKVKALSSSKLPLRSILDGGLFERSSEDSLEIPLGIGDGGNRIQLKLGKGSSHHSLIAGATGSGKSSLFHTLILSAMLHYNPDELNLYLMDFKSGTEFKIYEKYRLPHIKLLALDAKQEFGESILENLAAEMTERGGKFKSVGAASLKEYKKATGEAMPRILVVIDEFQVLFNESQNREVARNCAELAKRIVTEGRSFGIHLIMATQSTAIISELSLSAGVIEQMRIRIGMKCGENDSRFMFRDNSQKALELMKGPTGTAVLNPDYTEKDNIGFRVAYCDDDFRDNCLEVIEAEFANRECTMQTFEGNRVTKLFERYAENHSEEKEQANASAEVGEPIKVAPPLKIVFDKKKNHNVLICGADEKMADRIFNDIMLGVLKSGKATVYFTDGDALVDEEEFMPFCRQYQRFDGQFRAAENNRDIVEHVNEVYEQLRHRKKEKGSGAIFVMLRNLQYIDLYKKLLKGDFVDESEYTDAAEDTQDNSPDSFFDFTGSGSGNKYGLTEKFSELVGEGSNYGIYFIISCTDYQTVRDTMHFGSAALSKFTERFVFGMNDSDAGYLINDVSMAVPDDNTVYYTNGVKNTCQIRPYLFPGAEELKNYIDGGMNDAQLPRSGKKLRGESADVDLQSLAAKKLSILSGSEDTAAAQDNSDSDNEQVSLGKLGWMYFSGLGVPQDYEEARKWYDKAAKKGNSGAMYNLGWLYKNGQGVPQDYNLARQWYEKAAEKGHSSAMYNLALLYKNGQGVPQNYESAWQWFEKAAEKGHSSAMFNLALMYKNGQGGKRDYESARKCFEEAARKEHSGAMFNLGLLHYNGQGVSQNYESAWQWFEKAAKKGHSGAMYNLGLLHYNGQGVPQSYEKARQLFKDAADKGDINAMYNLALMYKNGQGGKRDYESARKCFEEAARKEHSGAMFNLGLMYENGQGVPQNYVTAREWYERAVKKDNSDAMCKLGLLYENGIGVPKDCDFARELYEKAIAKGSSEAMRLLGHHYYSKSEAPLDYKKAMELYEKAAKMGDREAMRWLGIMYESGRGESNNDYWARHWYDLARQCYEKAANEEKDCDAMRILAWMYHYGISGVQKDIILELFWGDRARQGYEKAAEKGDSGAMYSLGQMYENGHGVPRDYNKVLYWYEKGALNEHIDAMSALGRLYKCGSYKNNDVSINYKLALFWFEKAAKNGNSGAMYFLGVMYERGEGVPRNLNKAREWYEKSAAYKYDLAIEKLNNQE